jgi:chemotaxis signal transduction protein
LVFALDAGRYAIALAAAERIVWAAQITPLPAAPRLVLAMLNEARRVG